MQDIKNLKKAADRLALGIKNKERIFLYGDADLDGVSSVVILKETLESLGAEKIKIYFPDRAKEGYGVNKKALLRFKSYAPALFVALDCGISNFAEIKLAKSLGFQTIIVDHHEILGKPPEAALIVNPKQKGDKSFKGYSAAGLSLKLSQLLLKNDLKDLSDNDFMGLTALSIIADMMPRTDENELFIEQGLKILKTSKRPAIKVFFEKSDFRNFSFSEIVQKMVNILNSTEVKNRANETYLFLTAKTKKASNDLLCDLIKKSRERKALVEKIVKEAEKIIAKKPEDIIIFEGKASWPLPLTGIAATKICVSWHKPTFIFQRKKIESRGSVRMPAGQNGVKAMEHCSRLLEAYGGHPPAGGFSIKTKNLDKFKNCLADYFKN